MLLTSIYPLHTCLLTHSPTYLLKFIDLVIYLCTSLLTYLRYLLTYLLTLLTYLLTYLLTHLNYLLTLFICLFKLINQYPVQEYYSFHILLKSHQPQHRKCQLHTVTIQFNSSNLFLSHADHQLLLKREIPTKYTGKLLLYITSKGTKPQLFTRSQILTQIPSRSHHKSINLTPIYTVHLKAII